MIAYGAVLESVDQAEEVMLDVLVHTNDVFQVILEVCREIDRLVDLFTLEFRAKLQSKVDDQVPKLCSWGS